MAMELEQQSAAVQHELERSQADDDGDASETDDNETVPVEPLSHNMYNKIYNIAERFASTRIGQFAIATGDRVLQIIEDTAKWSLPQDKSEMKLKRPLPWIPFLAMIISLRILRIWITVAAIIIGNGPVMPNNVVYFIQTRRRKLRFIRLNGLKAIQQSEAQAKAKRAAGKDASLMGKVRKLFSLAICRPGQQPERRLFAASSTDSLMKRPLNSERAEKRRRDDSFSEHMTCDEMLTKYANENSDDDPDFIPNAEDEINDDSASSDADAECDTSTEKSKERETQTADNGNASQTHDKSVVELERSTSSSSRTKPGKQAMPLPLIEIKKEPLTDVDSGNEQLQQELTPKENGPSNGGGGGGGEPREAEVAKSMQNSTPNATTANKLKVTFNGSDKQQKSTPGHETAAAMKPKSSILPIFTGTATAAISNTNDNLDPINNTTQIQAQTPTTTINTIATASISNTTTTTATISTPATTTSATTSPHTEDADADAAAAATAAALATAVATSLSENVVETPKSSTQAISIVISDKREGTSLTPSSSAEDIFYSPLGSF